jgi:hypothetical protein
MGLYMDKGSIAETGEKFVHAWTQFMRGRRNVMENIDVCVVTVGNEWTNWLHFFFFEN